MSLEEEIAKLDHEHGQAIRRIVIEKGLFAVILVVVGVFANAWLEDFKVGLADRRHVLEIHERVLTDLRKSYGELSDFTYRVTQIDKEEGGRTNPAYETLLKEYDKSLSRFVNLANTSGRHLSEGFKRRLKQHVWFHEALAQRHRRLDRGHLAFAVAVFDNFDALTTYTRSAARIEVHGAESHGGFRFVEWTSRDILDKKAGAYMDALYREWARTGR